MAQLTAEYVHNIARQCIGATDYCFMITLNEQLDQAADARLMQPFAPEADLTIWFGASPRSRKVAQIQQHNQITVCYQNPTEPAYVTLLGTAHLEDDLALRQHYWRDDWLPFFPAGPTGDDYLLIKFVPTRIEVMHFAHEVAPDPYGLKPVTLVCAGDNWQIEA
jgi:general stress protein 26